MKQQSTQTNPLSPAAIRLFAALPPDRQFVILFSMQAMWEALHPKSRKYRDLELLGTPEQRKARTAFLLRGAKARRENAKFQAERTKRDRAIVRAMKGRA